MRLEERDPAYYEDMLNFARDAHRLAQDRKREDLDSDFIFRLASERILELVGEAARRVSEVGRATHPQIAWIDIVGMRNVLAHDYGEINYEKVWIALSEKIPDLIAKLEPIVAALPPPE